MSIYSGFATRQLEQQYDSYTQSLLSNMQKRIVKFYNGENSDDSMFFNVIKRLFNAMRKMEKYKYLEPKLSESFRELIDHINPAKEVSQIKNKMTEERSERDILHSPPLYLLPQEHFTKSKAIFNQFEKCMMLNPYEFSVEKPLTTRPSAEAILTTPEQNYKNRVTKHRNKTPDYKNDIKQLLQKNTNQQLKYYKASHNIRLRASSKKNRTLDFS